MGEWRRRAAGEGGAVLPAQPTFASLPSPEPPRRGKYYAVVSLGRQTFVSRRVRRSTQGGDGDDAAAAFSWEAGADFVLQRSGATVAQVQGRGGGF